MSAELLTAVASIGTFVVIGATAIAAMVQLRHIRASNQIAAVMKLNEIFQSQDFQRARRFVQQDLATRLHDAEFRKALSQVPIGEMARPLLIVGNVYEELGLFVKRSIMMAPARGGAVTGSDVRALHSA